MKVVPILATYLAPSLDINKSESQFPTDMLYQEMISFILENTKMSLTTTTR